MLDNSLNFLVKDRPPTHLQPLAKANYGEVAVGEMPIIDHQGPTAIENYLSAGVVVGNYVYVA